MQISFIGAGKVGVSLGKYFISKGRKGGGYDSLSPKSAAWAANFMWQAADASLSRRIRPKRRTKGSTQALL